MRVNATDNGTISTRQFSVNGGETWTNLNANTPQTTISTEGTTTVLYRATDNGGNVSEVGQVVLKIDKTAPTAPVFTGVTAGGEAGNAGDVSWSATDATSGIQSITATVDGAAVPGDQPLALWALPLGEHTIVVTAEDNAGFVTSSSITFTTTTSLAELTELSDRLVDSGEVTADGERKLTQRLAQAKKHADAGRITAAVAQLEGFISLLSDRSLVTDEDAAAALERDAREVIAQLRG